jgi:hypothetical protein
LVQEEQTHKLVLKVELPLLIQSLQPVAAEAQAELEMEEQPEDLAVAHVCFLFPVALVTLHPHLLLKEIMVGSDVGLPV